MKIRNNVDNKDVVDEVLINEFDEEWAEIESIPDVNENTQVIDSLSNDECSFETDNNCVDDCDGAKKEDIEIDEIENLDNFLNSKVLLLQNNQHIDTTKIILKFL